MSKHYQLKTHVVTTLSVIWPIVIVLLILWSIIPTVSFLALEVAAFVMFLGFLLWKTRYHSVFWSEYEDSWIEKGRGIRDRFRWKAGGRCPLCRRRISALGNFLRSWSRPDDEDRCPDCHISFRIKCLKCGRMEPNGRPVCLTLIDRISREIDGARVLATGSAVQAEAQYWEDHPEERRKWGWHQEWLEAQK